MTVSKFLEFKYILFRNICENGKNFGSLLIDVIYSDDDDGWTSFVMYMPKKCSLKSQNPEYEIASWSLFLYALWFDL